MSKTTSREGGTPQAIAPRWEKLREQFLQQIAPDSHFHRAFDDIEDIVFFAKNLAGETLFFSRGVLKHHGLDRDEQMIGRTDADLTPGPLADQYCADDRRVIESGQPFTGRLELWFDEVGLPAWYVTNKYPLRDRAGRVIGLMGTMRASTGTAGPTSGNARLAPAMAMLQGSLARFPPVGRLAVSCGLSVRHFQRAFSQAFGMSPRTYWMKCRIRSACFRLQQGDASIAVIADELGFCDQSNFTRHFRQHAGATPRKFIQDRRRHPS
jgi:AraC-like DNA-binding protein